MKKLFNENDIEQIKLHELDLEKIEIQLNNFISGFPFAKLVSPATIGNGIKQLTTDELDAYKSYFEDATTDVKLVKFVPASGAATRMFKMLHESYDLLKNDKSKYKELLEKKGNNSFSYFISKLNDFAFYPDLCNALKKDNLDINNLIKTNDFSIILEYILSKKGLDYANLPKALLKFHNYTDFDRKALDEHLVEGVEYVRDGNNEVNIHFTLSPEHIALFNEHCIIALQLTWKTNRLEIPLANLFFALRDMGL